MKPTSCDDAVRYVRGESRVELRIRGVRPVLTVICMDRVTSLSAAHRAVTSERIDAGVPAAPLRWCAPATSRTPADGKPGVGPPTTRPRSCPREPAHHSDRARYLILLASALIFAALVLFGASVEQTKNLEDGTGPSAKAVFLGASLTYRWKPNMDLQATFDLEYTKITAPITGKMSRTLVDVGNLVNAGGGETLLTTITSVDPIYVYFDVDERALMRYRQHFRKGATFRREIESYFSAIQFPPTGVRNEFAKEFLLLQHGFLYGIHLSECNSACSLHSDWFKLSSVGLSANYFQNFNNHIIGLALDRLRGLDKWQTFDRRSE